MHPTNYRMAALSGSMSHFDHFDSTPMEIVHDYHINLDYWNTAYKNGSTPMKEMQGMKNFNRFPSVLFHY